MTFRDYLCEQHACSAAIEWSGDRSAYDTWHDCPRVDWMLWLADHLDVRRELLVLCATGCARSVLHLVPEDDNRSRCAIETTEAWCYGRARLVEVRAASAVAASAVAASVVAAYAASAYASAASAAYADAAYAASAASDAAYAAAAAGLCTREHALARYAHGVREVIPWQHVADRLRAMGVEVEG